MGMKSPMVSQYYGEGAAPAMRDQSQLLVKCVWQGLTHQTMGMKSPMVSQKHGVVPEIIYKD